ncbi:MAG: CopG family transcriptional regulator [Acidimicrobiales bacterium]
MSGDEVKQFNVYLPASLIKRVKPRAVEEESSLSALVADALRTYPDDTHHQPRRTSKKERRR